jgi:membrane-associated phospholipid phosphatase
MSNVGEQPAARAKPGLLVWGIGLWLATAAFFLFIAVCAYFYDYFPADVRIAHAIQGIDVPAFGGFMHVMNFIGAAPMYIVLLLVFTIAFAVLRAGWESMITLLTVVPNAAGQLIKSLVERPRPSPHLVHVSVHETDFSFPSGHVLGTAALFGVLFFLIPAVVPWRPARWLVMAVCLLFVVAAGPARVYVGVHWPSDTLASYLLAFLFLGPPLAAYVRFRRPLP